jgi:hypothetical protein
MQFGLMLKILFVFGSTWMVFGRNEKLSNLYKNSIQSPMSKFSRRADSEKNYQTQFSL